eukprot:scaffold75819_cov32-Tisochrysis_lutea.AAC.2
MPTPGCECLTRSLSDCTFRAHATGGCSGHHIDVVSRYQTLHVIAVQNRGDPPAGAVAVLGSRRRGSCLVEARQWLISGTAVQRCGTFRGREVGSRAPGRESVGGLRKRGAAGLTCPRAGRAQTAATRCAQGSRTRQAGAMRGGDGGSASRQRDYTGRARGPPSGEGRGVAQ